MITNNSKSTGLGFFGALILVIICIAIGAGVTYAFVGTDLAQSIGLNLPSLHSSSLSSQRKYSSQAITPTIESQARIENTSSSSIIGEDKYWIANLAEKALPFVVNIKIEAKPVQMDNNQREKMREFFKQMPDEFGMPFDFNIPDMPDGTDNIPREGVGSGFIFSSDGKIVTNEHVVNEADKIIVTLENGKEYTAKLLGVDKYKDIAVIQIQATGLTIAPLGDSDKLRPGEPAIAIGSPYGLQHSVTAGIISTPAQTSGTVKEISGNDPRRITTRIQTDASINPGNSGGPLLNARGEVIGVNQAIVANANRIGFAIPINQVKQTIDQIIKTGDVKYPGMQVQIMSVENLQKIERPDVTELIKKGQFVSEGAYVKEVVANGPAAKAGIRAGDVIVEIENVRIKTDGQVIEEITKFKIGAQVRVKVALAGNPNSIVEKVVILADLNPSAYDRKQTQPQPQNNDNKKYFKRLP